MSRSSIAILTLSFACSDYGIVTVDKYYPEDTGGFPLEMDAEGNTPEEDDCVDSSTAFDIEEVSNLQDAFGLPNVRDGLMLSVPEESLSGGKTWRPTSVEVLVMYPEWYFDFYDDSNNLSVHFYPAQNPTLTSPYSVTIPIRKNQFNWQTITLPQDADWSSNDLQQVGAWVQFDLSDVVPEEGFEDEEYFVSLEWDSMGFPNVGYSNFELPCAQNWTDYSNGSYVQNTGQDCSWPMLKIEIETLTEGTCD